MKVVGSSDNTPYLQHTLSAAGAPT